MPKIQLRWVGHRLQGAATIIVSDGTLSTVEAIIHDGEHRLGHALPKLDDMLIKSSTGLHAQHDDGGHHAHEHHGHGYGQ